jgi:hypothetical protein
VELTRSLLEGTPRLFFVVRCRKGFLSSVWRFALTAGAFEEEAAACALRFLLCGGASTVRYVRFFSGRFGPIPRTACRLASRCRYDGLSKLTLFMAMKDAVQTVIH